MWLDGAGSEHHPYDWRSIMATVARHQPTAMIFNMGSSTIRWVGNEDGLASDPCWYTVDSTHRSMFDDGEDALMAGARYLPPECEVAIRWHWFWHQDDLDTLKTRQHLDASTDTVMVDEVLTIGSQRVHTFPRITTDRLHIEIDDASGQLHRA